MIGELQVPNWSWWIILYFFTGGVAGGAYFLSTVVEWVGTPQDRPLARMGYYLAFPLSILCVFFLIIDLGRPERFWHMVLYSKTLLPWVKWNSPMSVGSYVLLGFGAFSFLSFVDTLIETGRLPWAPWRDRYSGTPRRIFSLIGGLFGFVLTAYTGELLSTSHLPLWAQNPVLGALFAASGASTGMAAVMLGTLLARTDAGNALARLKHADARAMILELLLIIVLVIVSGAAAGSLLMGRGAVLFIGGVLLVGLLVPLILEWLADRPGSLRAASGLDTLIGVLVLIGGLLLRTMIVLGGQGLL